jgi:hypothetical protein
MHNYVQYKRRSKKARRLADIALSQKNECLERQPSRSINAVGKDDNSRQ